MRRKMLNKNGKKGERNDEMVKKRTNDTGKEQESQRKHETNLLKIAQINQNGVA